MGTEFTPVFLLLIVAMIMATSMIVISHYLGPRKDTKIKQMPYESGMDPIGDARQRFDVRYYLVSIVFLLFDIDLLFLYPWVVSAWSAEPGMVGSGTSSVIAGIPPEFRDLVLGEIVLFVIILSAGFAYVWRKGVFEWR
jgi:NADH-quinone oxidoreductase subunit A